MKLYVKILSGNMGDGWKDQFEAAKAYAEWIKTKHPESTVDVEEASGVGGRIWDAEGERLDISDQLWNAWCASEEAKEYFDNQN